MRTKLSVCNRKARYPSEAEAILAIQRSGLRLRLYQCDRCRRFHLTSRTKGKRVGVESAEQMRPNKRSMVVRSRADQSRETRAARRIGEASVDA